MSVQDICAVIGAVILVAATIVTVTVYIVRLENRIKATEEIRLEMPKHGFKVTG
jgi:hypothetical protein